MTSRTTAGAAPRSTRPRSDAGARSRAGTLVAVEPPSRLPFDVFESKLRVPELRAGIVSRTGLVNRLRAERTVRLVTLTAPPGYGKTTTLAQWAARDARPFAWVSVDERDNDPLVLLRHVAAAFDRIEPLDAAVLDALDEPEPSVWSAAAPRLTGSILRSRRPFVAVLDDASLLDGDSATFVATLAEHVPDGSLLVLAGRETPPAPIARARAEGRVLELGTRELALARREAELLLRNAGVKADDGVADLVARTEGWAAGLYLAARALEETGTHAGGADRFVFEYVTSEHLARLTPERLAFLRRTSVLERMSRELCDAVLSSDDAKLELDAVEQANLFLVPLDREGGWYRYHHVFREVLRRELAEREPELVPVLNARAADWLEAHGDLESALEHAQAAGDADRAARILTAIALPAYHDGRAADVEGWLERFATYAVLDDHPNVAVLGAWLHALRGRADDAVRWLGAAERGAPRDAHARGAIPLLRAALCHDGVERMEADLDAVLADLPADSPWTAIALLLRGTVDALRGQPELADARFTAAADAAADLGATETQVVAVAERSLLAAGAGDNVAADRLAGEASALLAASPVAGYGTTAIVRAAAARFALRRGRWDHARAELAAAEALPGPATDALPWLAAQTRLALAADYVALRDRDAARAQLAVLERLLASRQLADALAEQADEMRRQVDALPDGRDGRGASLTAAELRLLPLLATHLSFREIGERLFVSRNTIKTQAISTYRKLGVTGRSAAIERACELGLVDVAGEPVEVMHKG